MRITRRLGHLFHRLLRRLLLHLASAGDCRAHGPVRQHVRHQRVQADLPWRRQPQEGLSLSLPLSLSLALCIVTVRCTVEGTHKEAHCRKDELYKGRTVEGTCTHTTRRGVHTPSRVRLSIPPSCALLSFPPTSQCPPFHPLASAVPPLQKCSPPSLHRVPCFHSLAVALLPTH